MSHTSLVPGKTDGVAVPAGYVGESIQGTQTAATNFGGTGVYVDIASVSLTPGRWLLNGFATFYLNGSTTTQVIAGFGTASGNSSTGITEGVNWSYGMPPTAATNSSTSIPGVVIDLAATTTYYLKGYAVYSAGTPQYRGRITAIRIA